jgi:SAM-dependent methyltransferase
MNTQTPWQLKMLDKALKKKQKLETLRKHLRNLQNNRCLLITCGDNNGAMNYRIREWGGQWVWAELEDSNIWEMKTLLQEPVLRLDKTTCALPFLDGSFDCVLTIDCHEHLVEPLLLTRELWRITKVGGKVVVTVPNGNSRKLAVRVKHLVGMTKAEYGHVVIGYEIPQLCSILEKSGLAPYASSSYSKFFTEMLELGINYTYVKVLGKKGKVKVEQGTIAPTSQDQFRSIAKSYRFYSLLYPFLWLVSQLDTLLFFVAGHAVVVEARKT